MCPAGEEYARLTEILDRGDDGSVGIGRDSRLFGDGIVWRKDVGMGRFGATRDYIGSAKRRA